MIHLANFNMIFTYMLRSLKYKTYYVGIAKNAITRFKMHNKGYIVSTAKLRPWEMVYTKQHENYVEARKHEKWLKKKNHEYKNKLARQETKMERAAKNRCPQIRQENYLTRLAHPVRKIKA